MDMTDFRSGKLVAIRVIQRGTNKETIWLCQCDCGETRNIRGADLRNGHRISCGCIRRLKHGEAAFNSLLRNMKRGAQNRNYIWMLSNERVRELTKQDCFYCGIEPQQIISHPDYFGSYKYNGIDRIDNALGYVPFNVVSCCGICNRAKDIQTYEEFIGHCKAIVDQSAGWKWL